MNYLGHIYYTGSWDELMVGNLATDFLTLSERKTVSQPFQTGISLHYWMDDFTDQHRSVKAMKSLFQPYFSKYSPVAVDLCIDFLISHFWYRYNSMEWSDFRRTVYYAIHRYAPFFPEGPARRLKRMTAGDWLGKLANADEFKKMLVRMDDRAKFQSNFSELLARMLEYFEELSLLFHEFHADLMHRIPPVIEQMTSGFTPQN